MAHATDPVSPFLFRVFFVLSTIVFATDCCSSRIIHHNEPESLHLEAPHSAVISAVQRHETFGIRQKIEYRFPNNSSQVLNKTEKAAHDGDPTQPPPHINSKEFITSPAVRAQQSGNPQYHVIDIYYTIMRDVMSFECTGQFLTDFCLNKGRCFRYPIGNHSFFSCECADGYIGERCESKSMSEIFLLMPRVYDVPAQKIHAARIFFSFPMLLTISAIYLMVSGILVLRCPRKY